MTVKVKEYAVYKGDQFICIGTMEKCAEFIGVSVNTIRFYLSPAYHKRVKARKKAENYINVFCID